MKRASISQHCRAAIALLSLASAFSAADGRPNFVFILVDDLRWDAMSCAGHPFVRTPNIDKIASAGTRFTNAFVTISLCAPSRACFLTGTYAHINGVRTNEQMEFDHSMPTYPRLLQAAGYETAFIGKWHMKPVADPRPGFDYWLSFVGQGQYINPKLNENGRNFQAGGYITDLLTQYAVDFIKRPREKPFCLNLWHKAVHGPFTPADRHKDLYRDVLLPEPPSFRDTFEGKPTWQSRRRSAAGDDSQATRPSLADLQPPTWNPRDEQKLNYFRALAAVDDSVGRILEVLRETAVIDNTVIIFAGDNGYFHGEHRRGDKRAAYEESIRIPLVMCGPGVPRNGGKLEPMVLNIDIAPTILDLAGVKPPASMQGMSLKPLLAGATPAWRKSFLYEYFQEKQLSQVPTVAAVRTERWKYVTYPEIQDLDELYDLTRDPIEMHNLATDPAAKEQLQKMRAELERLKKETGYTPFSR
ncbi:MAG TPA: sulfatase [Phycisphaerae bacterium]|nr:sulfatase [Phycisphaerae bacterium]HRR87504.1 sulfatase [Phycisphaerae bacterium]